MPTLCSETTAALADLQRVPQELWPHVRYLSLMGVEPEQRKSFLQALDFHVNSLSKEADLADPQPVSATLVRINLLDYQMPGDVWELLPEPYFKVLQGKAEVQWREEERIIDHPGGRFVYPDDSGRVKESLHAGRFRVDLRFKVVGKASGCYPAWEALSRATKSKVPIVRADWFLYWTSDQFQRGGSGYYDFLGVKDLADFEELLGLDKKLAQRRRKEVAAAMKRSGVNVEGDRQFFRWGIVGGGVWGTFDPEGKEDAGDREKRNATRNLKPGTYAFDASEWYGTAPNGLFYFFLADAAGKGADIVPDTIASDNRSLTNDKRVHVFYSCVRCHQPGLQPIDDWVRRTYTGPLKVGTKSYEEYLELKRTFFGPLQEELDRDNQIYAAALLKCNGLSPKENAENYERHRRKFAEEDLGLQQTARELGVNPQAWLGVLKAYYSERTKGVEFRDPAFVELLVGQEYRPVWPLGGGATYAQRAPGKIRRQKDWEDHFPLAYKLTEGLRQ